MRVGEYGFFSLILVDDLDHPEKKRNLENKRYLQIVPIEETFSYLINESPPIKGIIHLGACSDTTETNAEFLEKNNTQFSKDLALYALKKGIRFVYASSAATYGDGSQGFSDDHALLKNLQPLNLYAHSKHQFDLWAQRENILDKIVGLKYFNVFGPNENHKGKMASVVQKMVPSLIKEHSLRFFASSEPELYADGEQCRDFIYVKDAVAMTLETFFNPLFKGIYNIGTGMATSWNRLGKAMFSALNLPVNIHYTPMPLELIGKYQNYTCADMAKFCSLSSYKPSSIEEAVKDYMCNHLLTQTPW